MFLDFGSSTRRRWSGKRDSNPRPSPWQGDALPLSYSRKSEENEDDLVRYPGGQFRLLWKEYWS